MGGGRANAPLGPVSGGLSAARRRSPIAQQAAEDSYSEFRSSLCAMCSTALS